MYKSSILLSAVGLSLAVITLTTPAATQYSRNPHGWGLGIEQVNASEIFNLKDYAVTLNYKKESWLFRQVHLSTGYLL